MQHDTNDLGQPIGLPLPKWKLPELLSREPMVGHFCRVELLNPQFHAESLYAANALDAEGRMWTYLPYGPFDTLNSYRAWIEEICCGNDPSFHAIIDTATGKAVGVASYLRIDPSSGSIEVGHISYSPLLQRTSAATEAMYLMMARAFSLGYRRYEWKCNALNAPSCAAAQRLGFTFEGIFRQATVVKGRNRDTAWYSVIDKEWPALARAFLRWLDPANFDEQGKQRTRLSALTSGSAMRSKLTSE
ncbi:MAG: GNAT family N-acetyltransferase [Verrucomicrobiales bacterium]|nr:GNAT family N-acetyltransferase [Verrucomicrobiales bacterium]